MTLRLALLGLGVIFGFSLWSACRPGSSSAQAQSADPVLTADEADGCGGGNHDEASRRYRTNQSTHWRQVAIRGH